MGKQQSKRDQQCMLMSGKINRSLQDQINKKKTGFNLTNYNLHTSVSEFSICCFDSSNKAIEIPLKVELPPQPLPSQKMPDGNTNSHSVLLNSQVLNCAETFSKSTNSAGDTNDDNCNKIEPFECELQVDTSSEKKQDWSFTLYDFDGRGKITKEELASLFQALYDTVGSSIRLPLNGTKKLKLRLSIGHDRSHLDRNPKDQSPPLVKKKAKLKNSSRLVEWKGVSLQPVDTGAHQALVEPSKECPKLNNLDGSPRAKASTVTKLENQLSPTTPGIGHRLTLSCKEQEKLTEMVHENMVRNQVRQQTGRKNHHSAHRHHHHHHHREARRHRVPRRQGDENRKPRERERTYYLDLGSIGHTGSQNPVAPGTTATATVTTSVMTFTRAPLIDVAPSSSSPPPPPPPTASGSTAHCNEIGMVAEDDDGEVVPETGPPGSRLKYGNNKSNIGANNPGTWGKSRQGEGVNLMAPTTAPGTADQPDPHHCRRQHHPHHNHHHHNHRRRSHPLRGSGDVGHTRCKHCNEQCSPVSFDVVKSGINGSQTVNKDQKREFAHRRYKNNNSNHNNKINHNNNNDNNNNNNNDNNNNNNNNNLKDVTNQTTTVHELSPASEGGDPSKQGPSHPPFKCQIAESNLKSGADCECSRYQKALCRQRVSNTGSLNIKSDNQPIPRHRNTEGQELTRMNINPQINTGSVGMAAAPPAPQAVAVTISHPPIEKKSSERLLKQSVTERHKKHNEGHNFSQAGRITSQECGGQTVPTPGLKILTPRGTVGAVAERKTLRTHHKAECSSHCVSSRHKPHWPANTTVPDKPMSNTQLALLPTQTSPAPPALNPTANGGPSNADAAAPASTASDTITNTITNNNNNNNNNNDNNNKDNSASTLTLQQPQHHHHHHHHLRRRNQSVRNIEFSEAMQQVADWINREHNVPQKEHAQPNAVPRASADAENFVHVQRHEHHHVHEYHHHHHYHHYYQT